MQLLVPHAVWPDAAAMREGQVASALYVGLSDCFASQAAHFDGGKYGDALHITAFLNHSLHRLFSFRDKAQSYAVCSLLAGKHVHTNLALD